MKFRNEFIQVADDEKFGLKELDSRIYVAHSRPAWTVREDKQVFLRYLNRERGDLSNVVNFHFHWHGTDFRFRVEDETIVGEDGQKCRIYRNLKMTGIDSIPLRDCIELPDNLSSRKTEIVSDVKNALAEFGDFGVHSLNMTLVIGFEF